MADRTIDTILIVTLCVASAVGLILIAIGFARNWNPVERPVAVFEPTYSLTLAPDGRSATLDGRVDFGLTAELSTMIDANPNLRQVILNSPGGYVAEARGAFYLIAGAGLSTHVTRYCASACALIFLGGDPRTVAREARLGFHSYALANGSMVGQIDPRAELLRDMEIYRSRRISEPFLANLAATHQPDMWYPTQEELRAAGVLSDPQRIDAQ
jgi:hypothetical protein